MDDAADDIRAAANDATDLIRTLEAAALQARQAREDAARETAIRKVRATTRSIEHAVARIVDAATGRKIVVPDPVTDLDQDQER